MADKRDERKYDEREVAIILQSAVNLQSHTGSAGLTLRELEQIAGEVGIDAATVRRAADQLDSGPPAPHIGFLGNAAEIVIARELSYEIDAATFDTIVASIRRVTGEIGELTASSRELGWRGRIGGAKSEILVSSHHRRSTIRVRVAMDERAGTAFMPRLGAGFVAFGGLSVLLGPAGVAAGLAAVGAGYWSARRTFAHMHDQARRHANRVVEAIVDASGPSSPAMLPGDER